MNNKKWVQMWQVLYWDQNQGHSSAMQQDILHFPKLQELLAFAIYTFVLSHYTMKTIPWQDFNTLSEKSKYFNLSPICRRL